MIKAKKYDIANKALHLTAIPLRSIAVKTPMVARFFLGVILLGILASPANAGTERRPEISPQGIGSPGRHRDRGPFLLPDVHLRDHHGRAFALRRKLQGHSLVLQFIFASCSTICPILSASLAAAQADLTRLDPGVRLVSISIDPEHDTPEVLAALAKDMQAGPDWYFLTGSPGDIMRVLRAFAASYPANNKMYHRPYTFIHLAGRRDWVRLYGLPGKDRLIAEYRRALADRAAAR